MAADLNERSEQIGQISSARPVPTVRWRSQAPELLGHLALEAGGQRVVALERGDL